MFQNDFLSTRLTKESHGQVPCLTASNQEKYWQYLEQFSDLNKRIAACMPTSKPEAIQKAGALSLLESLSVELFRTFVNPGEATGQVSRHCTHSR